MGTTEHTVNDVIAKLLRKTRAEWSKDSVILSEETSFLKGSSKRPDILVLESDVSPVVIENEFFPGVTLEKDVLSRLGERTRQGDRIIYATIGLRTPKRIKEYAGKDLFTELKNSRDLEFALYTGVSSSQWSRSPKTGWITGNINDLSLLVQAATVPPFVIEKAANILVDGIRSAAAVLEQIRSKHPGALDLICDELCQARRPETLQMATSILINAFVMHESLAGGPAELAEILSLDQLDRGEEKLTKTKVIAEWKKILKINYWPIFKVALSVLEHVPRHISEPFIASIIKTTHSLVESQLTRSHDLTGAVFQTLIADRKFLAAYYTLPSSSDLMANLVTRQYLSINTKAWSDPDVLRNIKIADLACGTGTLLSAVYRRIGQVHELSGGDASELHPDMMSNSIFGCDILPSAAHLTAAMLSSAHPTKKYKHSGVLCLPYGVQPSGAVALGSLDLLSTQKVVNVLTSDTTRLDPSERVIIDLYREIPEKDFDIMVMNPPFKRATGHEGGSLGFHNPMFAAFGSSREEQAVMGGAMKKLAASTGYHGNAGEASCFLFLAHQKLKENAALGLVMPLTLLAGDSWEKSRQLLRKNYSKMIVISISGSASKEISFSSDTSMGETMVVGLKGKPSEQACFVVLRGQPRSGHLSDVVAKQICEAIDCNRVPAISDRPSGGLSLRYGDQVIGEALMAPLPKTGPWGISRINDLGLAQMAYQLAEKNRIWLAGFSSENAVMVSLCKAKNIAELGPYHADINGRDQKGGVRGPFDVNQRERDSADEYPILWTHDAEREKTLVFSADCEAKVRRGSTQKEKDMIAKKVKAIAAKSSYLHINKDFRFNSQATSMQLTPQKTIGGQAWPSLKMEQKNDEIISAVWGNTIFGVLMYWWHANKQQSGRGRIPKNAIGNLKILDVTKLNDGQKEKALQIFRDFQKLPLRPVNEMAVDNTRKDMSRRFLLEVLQCTASPDEIIQCLDVLVEKLVREPSITGSKAVVTTSNESAQLSA